MIRRLPDRSLLDLGALPVADLARIAIREGVRPRPVYQAHKWFARRLAVTARSLLVAAAAREDASFWRVYYRPESWGERTVLDPFVGGGVMLLEASRLGANVQGVDIEPVAAAIANFQSTLRELPGLDEPLQELAATVGQVLAPYYQVEDEEGRCETLLHAFWVQSVDCAACGTRFDAHPAFCFAWDDAQSRQWVACRACSRVLVADLAAKTVSCTCGAETEILSGHSKSGEACCPKCGAKEKLINYARRTQATPVFRMFAVETLRDDSRRFALAFRRIRTATVFDQLRYRAAEQHLRRFLESNPSALPKGPIPREGRSDNRLIDYGYADYRQLFNARQQLHLALLGEAISRHKGPARDALAIAFSDHLTTNNMMCGYAGGWRRLTPLFSIRAYRHIARPVEVNPWLRKNGRGTFPNAVRAVARASEALRNPVEPNPKGYPKRVRDFQPGFSDITRGDARHLSHIPTGSVDFVLTDPPYFDYIAYSELGHFFTPWFIRFGLVKAPHARGFPAGQLAPSARSLEAERRFARRLAAAFKEMRRVCRRDGRIVYLYVPEPRRPRLAGDRQRDG
jgi:putative DNA methylase